MDLSVIIPTYKTGEYFIETIKSLKGQSSNKYSIEIFVILNGEKEPYFSILKNLQKDINFNLIYTDKIGVSNARNIGIEKAKGKFLLFLDDDDLLDQDYIHTLLTRANDENTIYSSNVLCFEDGSNTLYKDYIGNFVDGITDEDRRAFSSFRYRKLLSSSCFKLIPNKIIADHRFNTNLSTSEDALFMFGISNRINDIVICNHVFYYRRVRQTSASRRDQSNLQRIKHFLKISFNFTSVYRKKIFSYNFLFYLSRLGAALKTTIIKLST